MNTVKIQLLQLSNLRQKCVPAGMRYNSKRVKIFSLSNKSVLKDKIPNIIIPSNEVGPILRDKKGDKGLVRKSTLLLI